MNPSHSFISPSTNKNYAIIAPSRISIINCSTSNCIDLLLANIVSVSMLQYVGETDQTLRNRFNLHRSSIRISLKINNCRIVCDHNEKVIRKSPFSNNWSAWKLKLQTIFPYVLSDKIGEEQQKGSDIPIGISFPPLKSNKKHPTS